MSEIADELERMAKELDEAANRTHEARELPKHGDLDQVFAGVMTGYQKSAERLRKRAAELRQQRSGPVYKPQPKPAEVKAGQWWSFRDNESERVTSVGVSGAETCVFFNDIDWEYSPAEEMLSVDEWHYFGDGPEPAT